MQPTATAVCARVQEVSSQFTDHRNAVIEKWNRKTQIASGGSALTQKRFKAINQSVLTQIGSILEDRDRLIKRTRMKRVASGRVLGSKVTAVPAAAAAAAAATGHVDDEYDDEIFDDNDFYQTLLKDLISSGVGTVVECVCVCVCVYRVLLFTIYIASDKSS
jgi:protein AATF/BFR2